MSDAIPKKEKNPYWIEEDLGIYDDIPNVPLPEETQREILDIWRKGDTPEAWEKARKSFERSYGYKPSV